MNLELTSYLKKQSDFVAVAELEEELKLDREALFTEIETLIEAGYNIEFHPYLGVKLVDIPDKLLKHEIRDELNTRNVGRKLRIFDHVSSTNEEAWRLLEHEPDLKDGTVVLAESQSRGRGRMGREWHAPAGVGLWISVICRIALPPDKLPFLTATASLAVANMLQQFLQLPAEIKWPNDVMVRRRKVCGVLVEARSDLKDTYVMGIGLNVNQLKGEFPEHLKGIATSLRLERPGRKPLNRVRVLRPVLFYLDRVYQNLKKKKFERIAKAWAEFVHMGGKHVGLKFGGEPFIGTVVQVDPAEGITLKLDSGDTRLFSAEGVSRVREAPLEGGEPDIEETGVAPREADPRAKGESDEPQEAQG